ncbi:MAG: DNA recombination protein RmuC, partial [Patescibacteria group bacterium]
EDKQQKQLYQKAFLSDVRKHIKDIAQKYILTDEGTLDYALMYVPSEAVYYEIINSDPGLLDFAHQNRVLPVSPSTFYAYLRAILMSFEGQKIESRAKEILKTIKALEQDYHKIDSYLSVLNKHLTNAFNQMNNVSSAFTRLGQKISSTTSLPEPEENKIK